MVNIIVVLIMYLITQYIIVCICCRYSELPRKYYVHFPETTTTTTTVIRKQTLSQYFFSTNCILCNKLSQNGFCGQCEQNPQYIVTQLNHLLSKWTKKQHDLTTVIIKLVLCTTF